jgi:26S proteasome non-ATPase regulatory subunit 9
MGIPMDDIHTPSVASGPVSGSHANGISEDDMGLDQLMAEKERLESELKALSSVLDSVRGCYQPECFDANDFVARC